MDLNLQSGGSVQVSDAVFGADYNEPLIHQVVTAYMAGARAGTRAQRSRLLTSFQHMSASAVATFFDRYDNESFRIVRERKSNGPTVLVDTQITRPRKDPVDISYVVAKLRDRWWVIDIIIGGGISEIKVRRNEYATLLKEGGLDRLASELNAKAERLLSGKETVETVIQR